MSILRNHLKYYLKLNQRKMAQFKQTINPILGQSGWRIVDENFDYNQEVANAGFGDMLHDEERNKKYFEALRKTIKQMQASGRKVHVLDIGTGTVILSMMAASLGADSVTACEAFLPMANCAERIIKANGFADKIHLIKKRSTELQVGVDMLQRANLLVTEVLDTELIGEGAISIYNHAHDALLTEDVLCIPAKATCYAQVAESPLAAQMNTLKILPNLDGDVLLQPTASMRKCCGEAALHDVQLTQLPTDEFKLVTEPTAIFEFDFSSKQARPSKRSVNKLMKMASAHAGRRTDLVFYWWSITMDAPDAEIVLSCAPIWAHPNEYKHFKDMPWRDHWMQAIYYIPRPLQLQNAAEEFTLSCNHDEYSWWFDVLPKQDTNKIVPRHACTCLLHLNFSRNRIGQLNQAQRNKRYLRYLERNLNKQSHVLALGNGNLLALAMAQLNPASVSCLETHSFSHSLLEDIAKESNVKHVRFLKSLDELAPAELAQLTHIFAEPYFHDSILPWDNFLFGTLLAQIYEKLRTDIKISPHMASIHAVPVQFMDLHKIRTPVGECEGFDLKLFDEMVNEASNLSLSKVEAQPLWEYPCVALADSQEILRVEFRKFAQQPLTTEGVMPIKHSGLCNGIALWVDWNIDEEQPAHPAATVTTGPMKSIQPGYVPKWDMFVRQGVHFLPQAAVKPEDSAVRYKVHFNAKTGALEFTFKLESSRENK